VVISKWFCSKRNLSALLLGSVSCTVSSSSSSLAHFRTSHLSNVGWPAILLVFGPALLVGAACISTAARCSTSSRAWFGKLSMLAFSSGLYAAVALTSVAWGSGVGALRLCQSLASSHRRSHSRGSCWGGYTCGCVCRVACILCLLDPLDLLYGIGCRYFVRIVPRSFPGHCHSHPRCWGLCW
jgi:hypothetical protein